MSHPTAFSGSLFVVAAPSGAGKSTLVNALLAQEPGIKLSISTTTRAPRPGEQHGREYYFTTAEDFVARAEQGEFLEWAEVHGNYYGTSRTWVEERLRHDYDVILEIDWQGAQQVRQLMPEAVSIFILPPSLVALAERLNSRGTDSAEVIAHRLSEAIADIGHYAEFDFLVINDEFSVALQDLQAITRAARQSHRAQSKRQAELIMRLLSGS